LTEPIILTPNQKILFDFLTEKLKAEDSDRLNRESGYLHADLAKRLKAFWTPADYYFNDHGPNGRWSKKDYYNEVKNLERLGLIIRTSNPIRGNPTFRLNLTQPISVENPKDVDVSISRYELRILQRLEVETEPPILVKYSETDTVKADYVTLPSWKSVEVPINRLVQLGHASLRPSEFAGSPDTYRLSPIQKERISRIPLKKWGGVRQPKTTLPTKPRGRPRIYKDNAEKQRAYRKRKSTRV